MRLQCERSRLANDGSAAETWVETHTATVQWHESLKSWWVKIQPGVTGYESAQVADILRDKDQTNGWCCCAGTPGSWDRLRIPAGEFERLRDTLRLMPRVGEVER